MVETDEEFSAIVKLYLFTITEPKAYRFTSYSEDAAMLLFNETDLANLFESDYLASGFDFIYDFTTTGTYLLVMSTQPAAALPFNARMAATETLPPVWYYELDYQPSLSLNTLAVTGNFQNVIVDEGFFPCTDFSFQTEAGHNYFVEINFNFSSSNANAALLATVLHQNIDASEDIEDNMIALGDGYCNGSNTGNIVFAFTAETSENVKILLVYYLYGGIGTDVIASIKITENSVVQEAITLPELLDAAEEIQYSSLPITINGTFGANTPLVEGDDYYDFRTSGNNYCAVAYKMTLNGSQPIRVHEHSEGDALLYIYEKTDGNYVLVDYNDDYYHDNGNVNSNWSSYDSYIDGTLPAGEYWLVATNFRSANDGGAGSFYIEFYTNQPAAPKQIVSTAADVEYISVAADASDLDVKAALTSVNLTATDNTGETFAINNNPFGWTEITIYNNSSARIWEYINISVACYEIAENYTPATVSVRTSGLDETGLPDLKLYPNPALEQITISGLNGGERISIVDLNGKIMQTQNSALQETSINVSALVQGTYIVTVQNNGKLGVLKFVKK
ncbi:MAG: T9SS type A sorting domain-containing protein [Prevotellaceae bacterium]|jgi:hypothetical protein|nr:T9SS type A sorting domain-containing protein [Prevotellaceae bacterium]